MYVIALWYILLSSVGKLKERGIIHKSPVSRFPDSDSAVNWSCKHARFAWVIWHTCYLPQKFNHHHYQWKNIKLYLLYLLSTKNMDWTNVRPLYDFWQTTSMPDGCCTHQASFLLPQKCQNIREHTFYFDYQHRCSKKDMTSITTEGWALKEATMEPSTRSQKITFPSSDPLTTWASELVRQLSILYDCNSTPDCWIKHATNQIVSHSLLHCHTHRLDHEYFWYRVKDKSIRALL